MYVLITSFNGYIHAEAMPSRSAADYVKAFQITYEFFTSRGHNIEFQRLDNETSQLLEKFIKSKNIKIQYCAPGQHRANKAERAIRTFKNHFIATLCTTSTSFPLSLWDELLPQAELCLNHLIPYSLNFRISAYAGIHGASFDFKAHPIAPAGCAVIVHEKPAIRASWAPHGVSGYYLGPAVAHYRCYRTWITHTNTVRVTDTIAWIPEEFKIPTEYFGDYYHSNQTHDDTADNTLPINTSAPCILATPPTSKSSVLSINNKLPLVGFRG
jgi:hypothetical protein